MKACPPFSGKCGSVAIRLVPAPRGAGIVAARTPKKVLQMAGIEDCYTSTSGCCRTLGNFVKATFNALALTYGFLSPDLWKETKYIKSPLQVVWMGPMKYQESVYSTEYYEPWSI
jgi:small subunit ribosomal protein S2e